MGLIFPFKLEKQNTYVFCFLMETHRCTLDRFHPVLVDDTPWSLQEKDM